MEQLAHFSRWVLENPITLGIIGYLLVVPPIMGIWAIHKYGWQHWAPFDRGHKSLNDHRIVEFCEVWAHREDNAPLSGDVDQYFYYEFKTWRGY